MTTRPERPRAVVFDLDGTLVDTMPRVLDAYAHALAPFLPPLDREELARQLGSPPARFFCEVLPTQAQAREALQRLIDFMAGPGGGARPFPGAIALVRDLRRAGLAVGIWTGRDRASATEILAAHGLLGELAAWVAGDDLPSHKPDPAGLREVLRQLGRAPREVLFVGDAEVDALGGAAAGVTTWLIRPDGAAAAAAAQRVIRSPEEAYTEMRRTIFAEEK